MMMLAKYWNNKGMQNERMKNRVIWIISDMVMEYTWEDISDLINQKQSNEVLDLWDDWGWAAPVPTKMAKGDDKDLTMEQSINDLF
jgi:hypothetical protein